MKYLVLIFYIAFLSIHLQSQEFSTSSKKAMELFNEANIKMQMRDYKGAVEVLKKAVETDEKFTEAWLTMADAYDYLEQDENIIYACINAVKVGGDKYPISYFFLSNAYMRIGKYKEAHDNATIFLEKKTYTSLQKKKIDHLIANCKFAFDAMQHPVAFDPINLGPSINTSYDEYFPSLSADNEIILFNRQLPKNPEQQDKSHRYRNFQEDIFMSRNVQDKWTNAETLGFPVNTPDNEGTPFLTSDGLQLYFTGCNRPDGLGQCDIFVSEKTENGWSTPKNLGAPINTGASEKQPSLSSDGKTLYFNSNRGGGKGASDIWYSTQDENGNWTEPVNIGDSINTENSEQLPFIHPDNQTMYFTSNGHIGMGGFDIYISRKNADGSWKKPKNLGYPINSFADEIGFVVDAKAEYAYFSSNRNPENGDDLYFFKLPEQIKPQAVSYFKGKIFDADSHRPLKARFELINLKTNKVINRAFSNTFTGDFLICLPVNNEYALNVSRSNYLFYSDHFSLDSGYNINEPFLKDIALQPIKPGKTVILKNIFFETNSFELKNESRVELGRLEQFLKMNPEVKIEIGGHTDNVGNTTFNQTLSENRAKVVVNYLIEKGIEKERLTFKGYGETQPVGDNKTSGGKAKNRRTEFKILP